MAGEDQKQRFERLVMPHLHSAYNLARWLTGNDDDARDLVQEAMLRAYTFFDAFRGEGGRAWLLTIVRNAHYTQYGRRKPFAGSEEFDESLHSHNGGRDGDMDGDPLSALQRQDERAQVQRAIATLSPEFREVLVLRELEDLSYKEIASIIEAPIGTVMSRLARARTMVERTLRARLQAGQE